MKKLILTSIALCSFFVFLFVSNLEATEIEQNESEFFIKNLGQWHSDVDYLARLNGINYWITKNGIVLDYYKAERDEREFLENGRPNDQFGHVTKLYGQAIYSDIVGVSNVNDYTEDGKKEAYYNYFIGNDKSKWASNVPLFSSVTRKNILPGIDLRFYFVNHTVRYDYIVAPGADVNNLKVKYTGQNNYSISTENEITFATNVGEQKLGNLYAYQETNGIGQTSVECNFIDLGNGIVKLSVGEYDKSQELIIDPEAFITLIGGNGSDYQRNVGSDYDGNGLITGYTYSSNYPITSGAYDNSYNSTDIYVSKFNPGLQFLNFSTFLGGTSSDYGYAIDADENGYVYIGGYTSSSNYPTTSGAFDTSYNSTDGIITKLTPTGNALVYSTFIGGTSSEYCYTLKVTADGFAFAGGYTSSSNFPATSGAWDTSYNSTDGWVAKFNQNGSGLVFATYLGGTSSDYVYALDISYDGKAIVTGYTSSSNYPTTSNAYDNSYSSTDIFVTKFNFTGSSLEYSTYLGGTSSEYGYSICDDDNGNIYVAGYTNSSNYPLVNSIRYSYQSSEGVITKFNSSGGLVASTYIGGNSSDYVYGISYFNNIIFIAGYTYSSTITTTADAIRTYFGGGADAFAMALNSDLNAIIYSTYLGGSSYDYGYYYNNSAPDHLGGFYCGGYSQSSNFPTTSGVYDQTNNGGYDAFLAHFTFAPPFDFEVTTLYPSQMCKGEEFQVSYKFIESAPKPGNIFTVQLSNEYGNFISPVTIGSLMSDAEGTIYCTLPATDLPPSDMYRVRILSSNPAVTSDPSISTITVNPPPFAFNVVGDNGYCADAKVGAEVVLEKSEKYAYYQLYRDGVKVGVPLAGTNQPISFGRFKQVGTYTIEGVSPFGCLNMMSGSLDIQMIPLPASYTMTGGGMYYNQPGDGTYCENDIGVALGLNHGDIGINYTLKINGEDASVPIEGRGDEISFGYFTEEGTYTIEALSKKGGCFAAMNGSITVTMLPAPKIFNVLSTGTYCEGSAGNEIKLSSTETGILYTVYFNGKATNHTILGTGDAVSLGYFNQEGTYTVLATNTTTGCTNGMNGEISLAPVPSPTVFNTTGSGKFCQGSDGAVIVIDNSQTDVIYELYNNNTATGNTMVGTGSEITFPPVTANGTYTVIGTTINGSCSIDMNGSVEVSQVALPNVNITGNFAPDMQTTETYSIDSPIQSDSYLWKVINGTIEGSNSGTEITVTWADEKTGTIEVYRTNEFGCANSAVKNVNLANQLDADFIVKPGEGDVPFLVEFENASTGFISSYYWEFGDGTTSPQENPTHTYKQVGTYTVSLTVSHETDKDKETKSEIVKVYPANSVEEDGQSLNSNGTAGISLIEPNPAKTEIRFDYFLTYGQNIDLAIYDVLGNKVMSIVSGLAVEGSNTMKIDISKLGSGNYYLQLTTTDGNVTKHFNVVK